MSRRTLAVILGIVSLVLSSAALAIAATDATQSSADITVMPCSAWANDARPQIPANTLTDACVDDAGTLHTAPTSLEKTR